MTSLAVIILTHNEELHLDRAISSVESFATQVYVVDSGSTDRTVEIARRRGASVMEHAFESQAKQFQWALQNTAITTEWIMRLDADEVVEPDLAKEIQGRLGTLPPDVTGLNLKRKHIFMGRWIRHGDRYPLILLRIWRRGRARMEDRWMDEHMVLLEGHAITLVGGFADWNLQDLTYFTDKHNKYATREAAEIFAQRKKLSIHQIEHDVKQSSSQASIKRAIKERIYNRLPFGWGPLLYFLYRYVLRLGFLDGKSGLIYHFLQGYWYRFLVEAKVRELDQATRCLTDNAELVAEIRRLTGLELELQGAAAGP